MEIFLIFISVLSLALDKAHRLQMQSEHVSAFAPHMSHDIHHDLAALHYHVHDTSLLAASQAIPAASVREHMPFTTTTTFLPPAASPVAPSAVSAPPPAAREEAVPASDNLLLALVAFLLTTALTLGAFAGLTGLANDMCKVWLADADSHDNLDCLERHDLHVQNLHDAHVKNLRDQHQQHVMTLREEHEQHVITLIDQHMQTKADHETDLHVILDLYHMLRHECDEALSGTGRRLMDAEQTIRDLRKQIPGELSAEPDGSVVNAAGESIHDDDDDDDEESLLPFPALLSPALASPIGLHPTLARPPTRSRSCPPRLWGAPSRRRDSCPPVLPSAPPPPPPPALAPAAPAPSGKRKHRGKKHVAVANADGSVTLVSKITLKKQAQGGQAS